MEEELELFLRYEDIFALVKPVAILVLDLLKGSNFVEEKGPKQGAVASHELSDVKIIFALQTEVVTIYV